MLDNAIVDPIAPLKEPEVIPIPPVKEAPAAVNPLPIEFKEINAVEQRTEVPRACAPLIAVYASAQRAHGFPSLTPI